MLPAVSDYDVIVVGAGNAALAAAVSAREQGAGRVVALEKAPRALRGGNTHYSGGLLRIAFDRAEDLRVLVPDAEAQVPGFFAGVEPYPHRLFMADLLRVTDRRTDPELAEILIGRSYDTACWMERQGVEIRYDSAVAQLLQDKTGRVTGVVVQGPEGFAEVTGDAVVLGCGGFEANPEWRARYLGRPWDHAKVRGTRYNTGDGLRMAMELGALPHGQWTGCHSTPIDADAPPHGDRKLTDKTNRLSYPYGVLVNARGLRFFDEGEDFQFYTYAKLGGVILNEPGGIAWQIFDAKVQHLLEGRYKTGNPVTADSLDALVGKLNLDHATCRLTLDAYNAAAMGGRFDPTVRDGVATRGLAPAKSNWAQRLDTPPFVAYPVTGGITFTFGGVRVNDRAEVLSTSWTPIPGLYACGEMVGGLFHGNYPGGTGLMSGAVFGRLAGAQAAKHTAT